MSFVVDASIVAAWLLPDESNELAERARLAMTSEDALAPDLLLHEIRNILVIAERRNRITADGSVSILVALRKVPLIITSMNEDSGILKLAREHRLSGYDATYLALAIAQNAPLVTLDRKLDAAARVSGLTAFD
ncbi:type II toxin-antitoxin system VapC family toxin [Rhizobium sp. Root483D2]|uniref:type II toxin-antitoxin system VapC family toxin n=1 Tax=Rhizobium sp. Root483D2 TaxID=1736545 RepID=UPI000715B948|nr:type II toxin-antitoxin system VapC family toxin [Rhizobium sp. Root483D2]KQY19306.1 twitching motility protein PilT [Rhizobium sp. Root483D2]